MGTITAPTTTESRPADAAPPPGTAASRFFTDGRHHADSLAPADPAYRALWQELGSAATGGKGARPELLARTYRALGGTDPACAAHVGDAVELLHTAFVVHDDVIDHDTTRRGRLNVTGAFQESALRGGADPDAAANLGVAAGILAGDLALVGAISAVARTPAPAHVVARLLDLVEDAVRVTAAGELADVRLSLGVETPTFGEILTMEERKTAVYSFVLPMQAAAILVDTPRALATLPALDLVGRHLGAAFQLRDDLLGLFGDPARTGKSNLTDLREGKLTPIVAHARGTDAWAAVAPHLGNPDLTPEDAAAVRAALDQAGSRAFVENLACDHLAAARAFAGRAHLPAELLDWLGTDPAALVAQVRAA